MRHRVPSSEFGVRRNKPQYWKLRTHYSQLLNPLLICLVLFFSPTLVSGQPAPATEWNLLYPKIRDRLISREEARAKLNVLEIQLRDNGSKYRRGGREEKLAFPLKGYTSHSIGGKGGSGYQPRGYDFFDGNDHRGHPGHDLFIFDKNQDGIDDKTGKPVEVISASPGIVVSTNGGWQPSSPIRGGNYVWVFDPVTGRYFYYAHLEEIYVAVGQIISRGATLATVGRTGLNACPSRSPTHLHFTVHQSADGYPKPINPYRELVGNRGPKG